MASKGRYSPYTCVTKAWSTNQDHIAADAIINKEYLGTTIKGIIHSMLGFQQEHGQVAGVAYFPERKGLRLAKPPVRKNDWRGLYVLDNKQSDQWIKQETGPSARSDLGKEFWVILYSEAGPFCLFARRKETPRTNALVLPDIWNVTITVHPQLVQQAYRAAKPAFKRCKTVQDFTRMLETNSVNGNRQEPDARLKNSVFCNVTFADNIDPKLQKNLLKTKWLTIQNQIHESIFGELRSERLLPAVGHVMRSTLHYDFFEVLLFTRVGSRYEEFVSWKKNYTGMGGDKLSILLAEELVNELQQTQQPKKIKLTRKDGIMNPHLVQLTGLNEGIIIPLVNLKKVEGLMTLYFRQPTELDASQLQKLAELGRMIGVSIETSNAHEKVHRMATIDALTNIYNRRFFADQIEKELRRSKRYRHSMALIMIDIDTFKHYNDTNGHLMGDKLLRQFSDVLRRSVRAEDIVARYGGEEFVVVLPEADTQSGYIVAEKIRREVWKTKFPKGETQPKGRVSISLGVAELDDSVKTPQDLISHADHALYRAKDSGRNQTAVFDPDLDSVA